ncbi:hypothetical protein A8F94_08420 [Bacillus sp. FJAT-27225]|uniref:hypothetical protein n=1 Tax=Bacillus sp. FJAT-27225 TaxID=1743144 RepID=UPI00080C2789|nr:hypothetical protein [Bacillus sp. FJAT-27225]OCA87854.1 hypothetical protein A8F94_08420 [Bacillus sp. FJAT-27225]
MNDIKFTNAREKMRETIRVLNIEIWERFGGTEAEWKGTNYIYQRSARLMFWRLPDYQCPTDTIEKIEYDKVESICENAFNLPKRIVLG